MNQNVLRTVSRVYDNYRAMKTIKYDYQNIENEGMVIIYGIRTQ